MTEVAIIGMGPWGLAALERFASTARQVPGRTVAVHVVEPAKPGGGIFGAHEPDYMVLNTPCGQHSMYALAPEDGERRTGTGFFEWAVARGYRWRGTECVTEGPGEPVGPHDFLPRRLMGEYLEWAFEVLMGELPANMTVQLHPCSALDIEPGPGGELVHLSDGDRLAVDHVVLTAGHMQEVSGGTVASPDGTLHPYPMDYLWRVGPGDKVAVEGMGLVAMDVLTAMTLGLGGSYSDAGGGRLRYHPSGREPRVFMYSRSGYPYCAKAFGAADPVGDYRPAICTPEAIEALRRVPRPGAAPGTGHRLDARRELLPLVFAEMELCYYTTAARAALGPREAEAVKAALVEAYRQGRFDRAKADIAGRYGEFSAAGHFFAGDAVGYASPMDYSSTVYRYVAADVDAALQHTPLKAALETLRAVRETLRLAVEFKGLDHASHLDFLENLRGRFTRLVAGPPVFRNQQLLALVDAGVVDLSLGPAPVRSPLADGRAKLRSAHLAQPFETEVDMVVRAHLELPSVPRASSPVLVNLVRRGRVRPLDFEGVPAGSIDVTEDFHPVGRAGDVQPRLWVFGVLTEGARYFTLYVPSPKSRSRAAVDAEACARAVLGAPARPGSEAVARAGGVAVARPAPAPGPGALRVGLVNNMADGAFVDTERQWAAVLGRDVVIERYTLPGVERSPEVEALITEQYRDLDELWRRPPDALVVTGAEPRKAELSEEAYWPALSRLLEWAAGAVPYMAVSCLSAHAALWTYSGLPRRLLDAKCYGVYRQVFDPSHPLMQGVADLALPHSRFNEVPERDLRCAGYDVVATSPTAGWSVATGQVDRCRLLLLQGHPEYGRLTLLREYRRDLRRYREGAQGAYPNAPLGYLSPAAQARLGSLLSQDGHHFPFDELAAGVVAEWSAPASTMMSNWLEALRAHKAALPV